VPDFTLRLNDPDEFYEALLAAHENLNDEQSQLLSQALVFTFANQIGSVDQLKLLIKETATALTVE